MIYGAREHLILLFFLGLTSCSNNTENRISTEDDTVTLSGDENMSFKEDVKSKLPLTISIPGVVEEINRSRITNKSFEDIVQIELRNLSDKSITNIQTGLTMGYSQEPFRGTTINHTINLKPNRIGKISVPVDGYVLDVRVLKIRYSDGSYTENN